MAERALRRNPFNLGQPVDPAYFAGRVKEVRASVSAISQTRFGQAQHLLITGERGIGKSSMARFLRWLVEEPSRWPDSDFKFLTAFCIAESAHSSEDLSQLIITDLRRSLEQNTAIPEIRKKAQEIWEFVRERTIVDLRLLKVDLSKKEEEFEKLALTLAYTLEEIWGRVEQLGYNGMLIIIDEFERVSEQPGIASFLKTLFEKLSADSYGEIMFVVAGVTGVLDDLAEDHPSLQRLLTPITMPLMNEEEGTQLITNALESVDPPVRYEEGFPRWITYVSSGYPRFIQVLCYKTFEADKDNYLDPEDFGLGLQGEPGFQGAMEILEEREFGAMYEQCADSPPLTEILHTIAEYEEDVVTRQAILAKFSRGDSQLSAYLTRLMERDLVRRVARGEYQLPSPLFKYYVRLRSRAPTIEEENTK